MQLHAKEASNLLDATRLSEGERESEKKKSKRALYLGPGESSIWVDSRMAIAWLFGKYLNN